MYKNFDSVINFRAVQPSSLRRTSSEVYVDRGVCVEGRGGCVCVCCYVLIVSSHDQIRSTIIITIALMKSQFTIT